jgi:hypothetical protein
VLKVLGEEKEDLLDEHQAVKQLKERSSQLDPTATASIVGEFQGPSAEFLYGHPCLFS